MRILYSVMVVAVLSLGAISTAHAERPGPDGFYTTGVTVRKQGDKPLYTVVHEVKELPRSRSARGLVDAEVEKRFLFTPTGEMTCATFRAALRPRLIENGLAASTADAFLSACSKEKTRARAIVAIHYNPATKTTRLFVEGMGTTTLTGSAAMKAVWGVWLDRPERAGEKADLSGKL